MSNLASITAGQSSAAVLRPLVLSLALLAPTPTLWAQTRPADPADPQASVPELRYVGALSRYRPLQEAPMASWPQANEKTHQAGGWRAYAREKLAEESPAPQPAAPAAPAKGPAPHKSHGHHQHHGKH